MKRWERIVESALGTWNELLSLDNMPENYRITEKEITDAHVGFSGYQTEAESNANESVE